MNQVIESLKQNLVLLYRKGIDGDATLDQLRKQGQAKFTKLFPEHAGFRCDAKKFAPYVEEIAEDVKSIEDNAEQIEPQLLAETVKKMELVFTTLENLSRSIKAG